MENLWMRRICGRSLSSCSEWTLPSIEGILAPYNMAIDGDYCTFLFIMLIQIHGFLPRQRIWFITHQHYPIDKFVVNYWEFGSLLFAFRHKKVIGWGVTFQRRKKNRNNHDFGVTFSNFHDSPPNCIFGECFKWCEIEWSGWMLKYPDWRLILLKGMCNKSCYIW